MIPGLAFVSWVVPDGVTSGCEASVECGGAPGTAGSSAAGTAGVSAVLGVVLSLSVRPGGCAGCSMVVAGLASAVVAGAAIGVAAGEVAVGTGALIFSVDFC